MKVNGNSNVQSYWCIVKQLALWKIWAGLCQIWAQHAWLANDLAPRSETTTTWRISKPQPKYAKIWLIFHASSSQTLYSRYMYITDMLLYITSTEISIYKNAYFLFHVLLKIFKFSLNEIWTACGFSTHTNRKSICFLSNCNKRYHHCASTI